jgi:hypothetical protein
MNFLLFITILLFFLQNINAKFESHLKDWINVVAKSPGKPWPLPQSMISGTNVYSLDSRAFSFQYAETSQVCQLLTTAFNRYYKIIFLPENYEIVENKNFVKRNKKRKSRPDKIQDGSLLKRIIVNVQQACEDYPTLDSDESCKFKDLY